MKYSVNKRSLEKKLCLIYTALRKWFDIPIEMSSIYNKWILISRRGERFIYTWIQRNVKSVFMDIDFAAFS